MSDSIVVQPRDRIAAWTALTALLAVLAVQWTITRDVAEPYPAITFPSFAGTGGDNGSQCHFWTIEIRFVARNGEVRLSGLKDLFGIIPDGQHAFLAQNYLNPEYPRTSTVVDPTSMRYWAFPHWNQGLRLSAAERACDLSFRHWLKLRGEAMFGRTDFSHVDVRWFDCVSEVSGQGVVWRRNPSRIYSMNLDL